MFSKTSNWNSCYSLKQPLTKFTGAYLYECDMLELFNEMGFKTRFDHRGQPEVKAKLSSRFIRKLVKHEIKPLLAHSGNN